MVAHTHHFIVHTFELAGIHVLNLIQLWDAQFYPPIVAILNTIAVRLRPLPAKGFLVFVIILFIFSSDSYFLYYLKFSLIASPFELCKQFLVGEVGEVMSNFHNRRRLMDSRG